MPYLRTGKLLTLRAWAQVAVLAPKGPGETAPSFIVGCGRSGTTILGQILAAHPEVTYLSEPHHLWRAVDARTDVPGLHGSATGARFFLDASDRTDRAQKRFDTLIAGAARPGTRVIEKLPHNVARIGWLESITTGARYVHIVRNGLAVADSIGRIATHSTYRMAFKPRHNQWWGVDDAKWATLREQGAQRGYFAADVGELSTHAQRGAYEWLVSIGEADRRRAELGDRLLEFTYTEFTTRPGETLDRLCAHVGIGVPGDWRRRAVDMVRPEQALAGVALELPQAMAERFNSLQERYGFEGRACVRAERAT
jgi:hypothetical protein